MSNLISATLGRTVFVRMLGSAVITQALLSAASLLVGLILIRRTTDQEYGSYVLVVNALLLITQLQTQFTTTAMVLRMTAADAAERANLVGGLIREQRRLLPKLGAVAAVVAIILWLTHVVDQRTGVLALAAIAAALAALHREFFRMMLLAYRRALDVLRIDALYVVLLVCGALLATLTPAPALVAVLLLAFSAVAGGLLFSRTLWRHEPWNIEGGQGILRQIARIGMWTMAGSAIHWSFTQGYNYLVAGVLSVNAVAAIAATRLLMMPINMLSTGVSSLMMPTTSRWVREHGAGASFRRLALLSLSLVSLATLYFVCIWVMRDWIFLRVLKKQFAQRDLLIALWFVIFAMRVLGDQMCFLPLARGRYRILTGLTGTSAVVSLTVSYFAMRHVGMVGALIGVMCGELMHVAGLVTLAALEARNSKDTLIAA